MTILTADISPTQIALFLRAQVRFVAVLTTPNPALHCMHAPAEHTEQLAGQPENHKRLIKTCHKEYRLQGIPRDNMAEGNIFNWWQQVSISTMHSCIDAAIYFEKCALTTKMVRTSKDLKNTFNTGNVHQPLYIHVDLCMIIFGKQHKECNISDAFSKL